MTTQQAILTIMAMFNVVAIIGIAVLIIRMKRTWIQGLYLIMLLIGVSNALAMISTNDDLWEGIQSTLGNLGTEIIGAIAVIILIERFERQREDSLRKERLLNRIRLRSNADARAAMYELFQDDALMGKDTDLKDLDSLDDMQWEGLFKEHRNSLQRKPVNFMNLKLRRGTLANASLDHSVWHHVWCEGTSFRGATFIDAEFENVKFVDCDLTSVDWQGIKANSLCIEAPAGLDVFSVKRLQAACKSGKIKDLKIEIKRVGWLDETQILEKDADTLVIE